MKKLVLILVFMVSLFGMDFKKVTLEEFQLQGISSKIVYKSKLERDVKIGKLWDELLNSKSFDIAKSSDKKLYVLYWGYKKDALECFIGIKSKEPIEGFVSKKVAKSNYQHTTINYQPNINMSTLWDDIGDKKIKRNFKLDIEQYEYMDLAKKSYKINIYLSM